MKPSDYVRIAERARSAYRPLLCEFCGEETLSGAPISICANCESAIGSDRNALLSSDPHLVEALESIRGSLYKDDFASASAVYDSLIKERNKPQLLYAKGIMLIGQSNYETSMISYDRKGFMDENIQHKDRSLQLISEAKKDIAKASYMMKAATAEGATDPRLIYSVLLCELKMNNLRAAKDLVTKIGSADEKTLGPYSKLILSQVGGDYASALEVSEGIMKGDAPPVNVLYYSAFCNLKLGREDMAKSMLVALRGIVDERKIGNLLHDIEAFDAEKK